MKRVVLDTNVVVSGLLWSGAPFQVLKAAQSGQIQLITSEALISELLTVLLRPKFSQRFEAIGKTAESFVENYRALVERVQPAAITSVILEDPKDDDVLACALGGKADYVVSGDNDLLRLGRYEDIPILDVNQFLRYLA